MVPSVCLVALLCQCLQLSNTLPAGSFTSSGNGDAVEATQTLADNSPPPIDMDRARFDKDYVADKKNQYTFIQKLLVNILQPKPILDTISESEKYGNEGESFAKIGRGVVGGVESLTSLISSAVDLPFEALKSATRKATATLNNFGAKLVGL